MVAEQHYSFELLKDEEKSLKNQLAKMNQGIFMNLLIWIKQYCFKRNTEMQMQENSVQKINSENQLKKENFRVYYACECGKKYDNFPALYLHFQRKHFQKISTKITDDTCKVQEKFDEKVLTYLLSKESLKREVSKKIANAEMMKSEVQQLLNGFREDFSRKIDPFKSQVLMEISGSFKNYIFENLNKIKEEDLKTYLRQIPFLFNDFLLKVMGNAIQHERYPLVCEFLIALAKWLKENSFTDLVVQYVGFES